MCTCRGEWNDKLYAKRPDQAEYLFVDVRVRWIIDLLIEGYGRRWEGTVVDDY